MRIHNSTVLSKIFSARKKDMEMDMYILCLHTFEDDRVILTQEELDKAGTAIEKCLEGEGYLKGQKEKRGVWYVYNIDLQKIGAGVSQNVTIKSAELGYYHHRTMVKFCLKSPSGADLRKARGELKEKAEKILENYVKASINELIDRGEIRDEGHIKFLYTYPLIVRKGIENEDVPFSDYTTTLCFDIVDVRWQGLCQRRHVMRFSGPSAILHTEGEIHKRLLRDIINAIYQYCLYEEKLRDKYGPFENILDESILVKLWEHAISTMGGRPVDIQANKVSRLGVLTLIIAIILFIVRFLWDEREIIAHISRHMLS